MNCESCGKECGAKFYCSACGLEAVPTIRTEHGKKYLTYVLEQASK